MTESEKSERDNRDVIFCAREFQLKLKSTCQSQTLSHSVSSRRKKNGKKDVSRHLFKNNHKYTTQYIIKI